MCKPSSAPVALVAAVAKQVCAVVHGCVHDMFTVAIVWQ